MNKVPASGTTAVLRVSASLVKVHSETLPDFGPLLELILILKQVLDECVPQSLPSGHRSKAKSDR